ncbi:4'-phosphopantetheinyl transferase superfamily protein [Streptomyces sp. NPDC079167]|uniref:4'-phosphopantetheinyl transferase family protein n=1 Tax=Streptomyces sp. NPDC079167 TaxID=3154513 RepID=UPI0034242EA5
MIEGILPGCVAVAEAFDDPPGAELFPEEERAIRGSAERRRREFTTTRHCARRALAGLRIAPTAIPVGARREPRWPVGVVGSLTHCEGYRAAALAAENRLVSVGIDAEPHAPMPEGMLAGIAGPAETSRLAELGEEFPHVHWGRLAFSAKESVYKAWYPVARSRLEFHDAVLDFIPRTQTFTAELHRKGPSADGLELNRLTGRWLVLNGLILTAVTIAGRGSGAGGGGLTRPAGGGAPVDPKTDPRSECSSFRRLERAEVMITRDDMTAVIAECMALQTGEASVDYDTPIAIDSFSFVWLQHQLGERFGYDLQPPEGEVMQTLNSARAMHRYLAGLSPDRFAPVD